MKAQELINSELKTHNVEVKFTQKAFDDLVSFDKGRQKVIIASIIKRGKKGPLIKPDGLGDPLRGELAGFTKIKLKKEGIRTVYKPNKSNYVEMGIIVVGPRKDNKVYSMAIKRLQQFNDELAT